MNDKQIAAATQEFWRLHSASVEHGDELRFHHLLLLNQWVAMRGDPTKKPPTELTMALLRPCAAAYMLAQGHDEAHVRGHVVEVMEGMERGLRDMYERERENMKQSGKSQKAAAKKWAASNVTSIFDAKKGKPDV